MNDVEIIELGKQAGLCDKEGRDDNSIIITDHLRRFAKLVADAERESCAKVCDRMAQRTQDIRSAALESAAENIRARGQA